MKVRIIPILLLMAMVLPIAFNYLTYRLERNAAVADFSMTRTQISKDKIQTIYFSSNEIIPWEIKGKEFTVNGKLFDVIQILKGSDFVAIECVSDQKEDKIVSEYFKSFESSGKSDRGSTTLPKVKEIKFISVGSIALPALLYDRRAASYIPHNEEVLETYLTIVSPPPEFYYALSS